MPCSSAPPPAASFPVAFALHVFVSVGANRPTNRRTTYTQKKYAGRKRQECPYIKDYKFLFCVLLQVRLFGRGGPAADFVVALQCHACRKVVILCLAMAKATPVQILHIEV